MLSKYVGASNILKEHHKNIMTGTDGPFINSFLVILKGQSIVHMPIKYVFTKNQSPPMLKKSMFSKSSHAFISIQSIFLNQFSQ